MLTNVRTFDLNNVENLKTVVEHVSLYVGLVIFTACGAKVKLKFVVSKIGRKIILCSLGSVNPQYW